METCRETFWDDIVAVWPLAVGVLTHSVPETVVRDTVNVTDIGNSSGTAFANMDALRDMLATKVRLAEQEEGENTLLLEEAPTLKIATNRSVSGYYYTATLSMKTLYYREEEKAVIRGMEWGKCDYVVERQDGELCLLRYFAPAQKFTHDMSGEGASLKMEMKNLTGLQRIIEEDESDG